MDKRRKIGKANEKSKNRKSKKAKDEKVKKRGTEREEGVPRAHAGLLDLLRAHLDHRRQVFVAVMQ